MPWYVLSGIALISGVIVYASIAHIFVVSQSVKSFATTARSGVQGVIDAEPDVRVSETYYVVRIGQVRVRVKAPLYPEYAFGDTMHLSCTMSEYTKAQDSRFNTEKFFLSQSIMASCTAKSFYVLNGIPKKQSIYGMLIMFKQRIATVVNHLWSEPYASFMAGVLYGYRGGLGELGDQFRRTGVSHIVAVSGYNVTVIGSAFMALLAWCLVPKRKALLWSIGMIALFVVFTGASASVMRAGIMGSLVLFARMSGRLVKPWKLLLFAATGMALANPYVLLYDPGFQLSFFATAGLMYLSQDISQKLVRVPEFLGLREALSTTLAALVAVLPISLYLFESFSIVSPLVNVLVVPVIPFIMMSGFAAVLSGAFHSFFGMIVGFPAFAAMWYVVRIVQFFAKFSFASITVGWFGGILVFVYYAVLVAYMMRKKLYTWYVAQ